MNSLKWFQILVPNKNSFICIQLNGFKLRDVELTIQFKHTVEEFQVLLTTLMNLININHSFVYS